MTVTPSPQSVVVPVELLAPIAAMWREASCHDLAPADDKHAWGFNRADLYWGDIRKLAEAAAPAPSSLAGGEVRETVARICDPGAWRTRDRQYAEIERSTFVTDKASARKSSDSYVAKSFRQADEILAALSPEAPAREGGGGAVSEAELRDAITLILPMAKGYAAAHPVGSNQSYVDYVDGLIALTPRHEAPAEGAGEAMMLVGSPFGTGFSEPRLVRARSSAPEARS